MIDEALSKLTEEQIREFAFLYMWLRDGGTSRKGLRKCYRPMDAPYVMDTKRSKLYAIYDSIRCIN